MNPAFSDSTTSCLQDDASAQIVTEQEENIRNFSSRSADAGDHHLLYATVCFNAEAAAQPGERVQSAAGPSDVYTVIQHRES